MSVQQKPVIHGRDHSPGGPDPIFGVGGDVEWEDVGGAVGLADPTFAGDCYIVQRVGPNAAGYYDYVPDWTTVGVGSTYVPLYKNTLSATFAYSSGYASDAKYAVVIGTNLWFRVSIFWRFLRLNTNTTPLENHGVTGTLVSAGATISGASWQRPPVPVFAHQAKWSGGSAGAGVLLQGNFHRLQRCLANRVPVQRLLLQLPQHGFGPARSDQ